MAFVALLLFIILVDADGVHPEWNVTVLLSKIMQGAVQAGADLKTESAAFNYVSRLLVAQDVRQRDKGRPAVEGCMKTLRWTCGHLPRQEKASKHGSREPKKASCMCNSPLTVVRER